ncbi:MAG: hypothetical protein H6811_10525 [Phycisphaeraceae bacterium]|nr:hypothetical protein [Phycisphaeraceae bacterium]
MAATAEQPEATSPAPGGPPATARGLLAALPIRRKLIVLHTVFWLLLLGGLLVGLRPAIQQVVVSAERNEARAILDTWLVRSDEATAQPNASEIEEGIDVSVGDLDAIAPDAAVEQLARATPGAAVIEHGRSSAGSVVALIPGPPQRWIRVRVRDAQARAAVWRLYSVLGISLLVIYGLVAASLELFVLPRHVYAPIRTMLRAERAVQEGDLAAEQIPESQIPNDELGEIMRSRNTSVRQMREHERALADALDQLERVANDLARKNHLLERARQHIADADRLRSLAIMSAGLAHEMNTPLTVLRGLGERLAASPREGLPRDQAELLLRVVTRLEGLSESLLDFARVRPPASRRVEIAPLVREAVTLVRLDREARDIEFVQAIPDALTAECDADRIMQVLVNLCRNAVDAIRALPESPREPAVIEITAETIARDGEDWVSIRVRDTGPGLDPHILTHLFEPFASTRLDARGTGLGLAVANGIVREHGGVLLARNENAPRGALFEVLIPAVAQPGPQPGQQ